MTSPIFTFLIKKPECTRLIRIRFVAVETCKNLVGFNNGSADEEGGGGGGGNGAWYDDDEPVMDEEEVDPDDIPETKPPPKRTADPLTAPVKIEPTEKISDWAEEIEPVGDQLMRLAA